MAFCSGIKKSGERCKAQALRNSEFCINHDPTKSDERRRRASKGGRRAGRGRPLAELSEAKLMCRGLASRVLNGTLNRSDASVANQLLNTYVRCISVELQAREQLELAAELEQIRDTLENNKKRLHHYGHQSQQY